MTASTEFAETTRTTDAAILKHLQLLNKYSNLQQQLGVQASDAFIKLSRARYHGSRLSTDSFPEYFESYVAVKNQELHGGNKHEKFSESAVDTVVERGKETHTFSVSKGDIQTLADELHAVTIEQESTNKDSETNGSIDTKEWQVAEDSSELVHTWQIDTSRDKKKNPLRTIEILPSQPLRQTQSAFHACIRLFVELATVTMELRSIETVLHKSEDVIHLSDNTPTKDEDQAKSVSETTTRVTNRADKPN